MYPSSDQGSGNDAPSPYGTPPSPYPSQEPVAPSAYDQAQAALSAYAQGRTPTQDASALPAGPYSGPSPYLNAGMDDSAASPYAYSAPMPLSAPAQPRPEIRQALIVDLVAFPWRSVRSFFVPSSRNFTNELLNARRGLLWFPIFLLPLFASLVALLCVAIPGVATSAVTGSMVVGMLLGPLLVLPLLFFAMQGLMWLGASHYKGGASFLQQCYVTLLPLTPILVLSTTITLLLIVSSSSGVVALLILAAFVLLIYSWVVLTLAIRAAHGVTGGEAFVIAMIPIFAIIIVAVIVLIVAAMSNSSSSSNNNSNKNNKSSSDSSNNNSSNTDYYADRRYYNNRYGWGCWWGPSYYNNTYNAYNSAGGVQVMWYKMLMLCPACQYRRWMMRNNQAQTDVPCLRCQTPMQETGQTR